MEIEAALPQDLTVPPAGLMRAPRILEICITGRCNLACRYCAYADQMTARRDLPTERWLAFFDELGALAVQRVTLTGGEIFTRPDLFTLVDGVIANRMRYSLVTNATLVNEQTIAAFEVGKRRLRLDYIQVSIDGSRAEIHDLSRPPASFERALRGLKLLKAAGLPMTVRVTINHYNVDDLENIAHLLLDEVGLPAFGSNETEPLGSASCGGQELQLTPAERARAMRSLQALEARYPGRLYAKAGPLSQGKEFHEIERRLAAGEGAAPGRGHLSACGMDRLAVLHDGTLLPCTLLYGLPLGVAGEIPLQEVWLHHPAINKVRYRRRVALKDLPACQGCAYTAYCSGGCPAISLARGRGMFDRDERACYHAYLAGRQAGGEEPL